MAFESAEMNNRAQKSAGSFKRDCKGKVLPSLVPMTLLVQVVRGNRSWGARRPATYSKSYDV